MKYRMNGLVWTVVCVGGNSTKLRRSDGSITVGMCDRAAQKIYISKSLRGAFLSKVLIHEICHSAMFSYGVELSVAQEEIFCDLVATYGREILQAADRLAGVLAREDKELREIMKKISKKGLTVQNL